MTAAEMNKSEQEAWRLLKERGDMITALQSRVKELEAKNAELKKCPNEAWECAKEQRRVEAENARLRKVVEAAKAYAKWGASIGPNARKDWAALTEALREPDAPKKLEENVCQWCLEKDCPSC